MITNCRLGSVPYLNAKPLIRGIESETVLEVPSKLAERFRAGAYDAALIPVFEALALGPGRWVDNIAIACDGPVYSVFLAYRGALEEVREIALDPASRTSVHLLQVLLRKFLKLDPDLLTAPRDVSTARLVIGDPAIEFRSGDPDGWKFLDLGDEWKRWTGLPFVFACWVLKDGAPAELAVQLRAAKARGLEELDAIAAETPAPEFALTYLTQYIKFNLGPREKQSLAKFFELLVEQGFLPLERVEAPVFI